MENKIMEVAELAARNWLLLVGIALFFSGVAGLGKKAVEEIKKDTPLWVWILTIVLGLGLIIIWATTRPKKDAPTPPPVVVHHSPITTDSLVKRIVIALEKARAGLDRNDISFEGAELEISVKKKEGSGAGLELLVAEASASVEAEEVFTITYKLKEWLDVANAQTQFLKAESAGIKDINIYRKIVPPLKFKPSILSRPNSSDLPSVKRSVEEIKYSRRPVPIDDPLVLIIFSALNDYRGMKDKFGLVCFDVEISFEVTVEGKIEVKASIIKDAVGASGSQSLARGKKHSIKFSFGKCG